MRLHFHRGTLLLSDPPYPPWTADLPGVLWDERVRAWRAPAFRFADLRAALRARGVRFPSAPGHPPYVRPDGELRPYQEAALLAWDLRDRRGLVVLPTGAGKTRLAIEAMARHDGRALVLAPTRVLLEQWLGQLRAHGVPAPGCYGDGRRELRPITVATFESAWRHMEHLGNRFELLVVDEAHHFGGGARDEALEMCAAPARLGLTATPPEGQGAALLGELVGPTVYRLGIGDLAGSYLAPYDRVTLQLDLSPAERELYERRMASFRLVHRTWRAQNPGSSWGEFARAASASAEGRAALKALRKAKDMLSWTASKQRVVATLLDRHKDDRMLLFTTDNRAAYAIARAHLVMPLTCHISRAERAHALERFRAGELRALVSAQVLNEGVDVPAASVGVVVGGARGAREHVQRVGRLLRPAPGKRALIYELVMAGTSEVRKADSRSQGLAPGRVAAV